MPWQHHGPLPLPCPSGSSTALGICKDEFYCVDEGRVSLCPARSGGASPCHPAPHPWAPSCMAQILLFHSASPTQTAAVNAHKVWHHHQRESCRFCFLHP